MIKWLMLLLVMLVIIFPIEAKTSADKSLLLLRDSAIQLVKSEKYVEALLLLKDINKRNADKNKLKGEVENQLGIVYSRQSKYHLALKSYNRAISIFSQIGDSLNIANTTINKGVTYYRIGLLDEALLNYLKAYNFLVQSTDTVGVANCLGNIAIVYDEQEKYEKSLKTYVKAYELRKQYVVRDSLNEAINLNNIGAVLIPLQKYDSAIHIFNIVRASISNTNLLSAVNVNLAFLYREKKAYKKAHYHINEALNIALETDNFYNQTVAYQNLGFLYRETKKYALAEEKLKIALDKAETKRLLLIKKEILLELSLVYEGMKMFEQALEYKKRYIAQKDSLLDIQKEREIMVVETKSRLQKSKYKNVLLKKEKQALVEKSRLYIIISGLVLLLVCIVFFLQRRNSKKEIALMTIQKKILEDELEEHQKSLRQSLNNISSKNKVIETLNAEIKVLGATVQQKKVSLETISKIKILTDDDWSNFKKHFEALEPDLIRNLRKKYPELTVSEERLFLLLKLNYDSSEISNILGVLPDSVMKIRYRLRKKLGLKKQQSLEDEVRRFVV